MREYDNNMKSAVKENKCIEKIRESLIKKNTEEANEDIEFLLRRL